MTDAFFILAQQAGSTAVPSPDAPGLFGEDFTNGAIGLTVVFLLGLTVLGVVLLSGKKPKPES